MFSWKWCHTLFFSNVKLTTAPSHTQEQLVSAQSHHGYLSRWLSCPSLLLFLKPMHKRCTPLLSPSRNTKNVCLNVFEVLTSHTLTINLHPILPSFHALIQLSVCFQKVQSREKNKSVHQGHMCRDGRVHMNTKKKN